MVMNMDTATTFRRSPLRFGVAEPVRQILRRRAGSSRFEAVWAHGPTRVHVTILGVHRDDRVVIGRGDIVGLADWDELSLLPRPRRCA